MTDEDAIVAAALSDAFGGTVAEWKAAVLAGGALGFAPEDVLRTARTTRPRTPEGLVHLLALVRRSVDTGPRPVEVESVRRTWCRRGSPDRAPDRSA